MGRRAIGRRAAVVAALFSAGAVLADEPPKWGAHLDVEAKPGNKRSLGEMALFVPLKQDGRSLLFGNLIGRFDDHSSREANAGIGFRRMHANGWNVGLYGFFDRRRSNYGNYFNQATLGAEALGRDWDFRGNLYHPLGSRVRDFGSSSSGGTSTASLSGTTVQVTTTSATTTTREERALPGFDAEVGWRVPLFGPDDRRQLRVYLGGYRFADALTRVTGPRARVEYTVAELPNLWKGAELTLGAETQDDNVRGGQHFASLRLRIPLGGKAPRSTLGAQERRMTAPVVRDVDIVTSNHAATVVTVPGVTETATATSGGSTITVLDSATTSGANLPTAVANAGANSTVILSGTFNTTAATTMQSGQTLIGAGTLTVRTASGRTATLTTPGGTIAGAVVDRTLHVPNNNAVVSGLTVSNTGTSISYAISVSGNTGVVIANNTITTTTTGAGNSVGLRIATGASATVRGNTITATANARAYTLLVSGSATVNGNTFSASGGINSYYLWLDSATIGAGSTGNVKGSGTTCSSSGTITGSVSFTDGSTCP